MELRSKTIRFSKSKRYNLRCKEETLQNELQELDLQWEFLWSGAFRQLRSLKKRIKTDTRIKRRFSSSDNFYITTSRLSQTQGSFAKFGAKLWNSLHDKFRQLPKSASKYVAFDTGGWGWLCWSAYATVENCKVCITDQLSYFSYPVTNVILVILVSSF